MCRTVRLPEEGTEEYDSLVEDLKEHISIIDYNLRSARLLLESGSLRNVLGILEAISEDAKLALTDDWGISMFELGGGGHAVVA